jgi:hypothetical protein
VEGVGFLEEIDVRRQGCSIELGDRVRGAVSRQVSLKVPSVSVRSTTRSGKYESRLSHLTA